MLYQWKSLYLIAAACAQIPTAHAALTVAELAPGDLVITEYLANPAGVADTSGEYFEIYNGASQPVDLAGLVVRDDGSNGFTVDALSVGAGAFAVFGNGDGSELGITVDFSYGSAMSLTNTDDEIVLVGAGDVELFRLAYTDGDAFGAGVAHELVSLVPGLAAATGPAAGTDYRAAIAALALGNFGSPGAAGNTALATVPLPASAWLFGAALGLLAACRRRLQRRSAGS